MPGFLAAGISERLIVERSKAGRWGVKWPESCARPRPCRESLTAKLCRERSLSRVRERFSDNIAPTLARVILFGAGASFGAGDVIPTRPPLGNRLFDELVLCYPGSWGSLPPDIDSNFREDFETGMAVLWDRHSHVVPALMQQMALYFIQFRPRKAGSTLYCALTEKIKDHRAARTVLLSTLNYECLIEYAITAQSMAINYDDFPASNGAVTVWKLHGSCNFLPEGIQATRGVRFTRGVTFGTAVRPVGDANEVARFCLGDNALPPVMCLFMEGKPSQVSPGTVVAMQEAWRSVVATAEKVAIVGVHPNPVDAHLWDALAATQARLLFIGDEKAFSDWAASHRPKGESEVMASSFAQGFNRLVDEILGR